MGFLLLPELSLLNRFAFAATRFRYRWTIFSPKRQPSGSSSLQEQHLSFHGPFACAFNSAPPRQKRKCRRGTTGLLKRSPRGKRMNCFSIWPQDGARLGIIEGWEEVNEMTYQKPCWIIVPPTKRFRMADATYHLNGGFKPTMNRFADLSGPDFSPDLTLAGQHTADFAATVSARPDLRGLYR